MNLRLYVPPNFDFRQEIGTFRSKLYPNQSEGRRSQYLDTHTDKYKYFLHFIYLRTVTSKNKTFNSYIEVCADDFRALLGKNYYRDILKFYLTEGIVECDNKFYHNYGYSMRSKALGYRITKEFMRKHPVFFEDMFVHEKLEAKLRLKNVANRSKMDAVTRDIFRNLEHVKIDYHRAMEAVVGANNEAVVSLYNELPGDIIVTEEMVAGQYSVLVPKVVTKSKTALSRAKSVIDKFRTRYVSITSIHRKEFYAIRDKSGRRVHTNLTNLASELRQYLVVPGVTLVQIDCRNSQPFIMTAVIKEYHRINKTPYSPSTQKYIDLVRAGEFYSYMKEKLGVRDEDEAFKERFFKNIFYCRNSTALESPEFKVFHECFPTVAEISLQERACDHAAFSIKMQHIESSVCLDQTLAYLFGRYKSDWFSHVHDSILCDVKHVEEVVNLMKVYYSQACGAEPSLRAEYLSTKAAIEQQDVSESISELMGVFQTGTEGGGARNRGWGDNEYGQRAATGVATVMLAEERVEQSALCEEEFFNLSSEQMKEYLEGRTSGPNITRSVTPRREVGYLHW